MLSTLSRRLSRHEMALSCHSVQHRGIIGLSLGRTSATHSKQRLLIADKGIPAEHGSGALQDSTIR